MNKFYHLLKRFFLQKILCHGLVLDVGCGEGTFQTKKIIGLDLDKNRLARCPYTFKVQGDAQYLPFKSKSFDVALEMGCLLYVKDWRKALEEMKRVGMRVYLIEPIREKIGGTGFPCLSS